MPLTCKNCQYERPNNFKGTDKTCPICQTPYDLDDLQNYMPSSVASQSQSNNAGAEVSQQNNARSEDAKSGYAEENVVPVLLGIFAVATIPLFFIGGTFLSYVAAFIAAFMLAGYAALQSVGQRQISYESGGKVDIGVLGLGSGVYVVIVALLVIWSSFYFWNKSEKEARAIAEKAKWEKELQEAHGKPKLSPDAVPCSVLEEWAKTQPLDSMQRANGVEYAREHGNCF